MSLLHLDSAGDHLAHIESRQHDRQKSDRSEDGEPASHVVRNDKCLVAFLCGEGLEGSLVSVGDGDNPFGSVLVGLLDVFLDDPERDRRLGCGAGLGDHHGGDIPLGHKIHQLREVLFGKIVTCEDNLRSLFRPAKLLGEIVGECLDGAAGSEIGSTDADNDHQVDTFRLPAVTYRLAIGDQ